MRRLIRDNALSLVLFALFFAFLIGQSLAGQHEYNDEQLEHHQPTVSYFDYLKTGHFVEAVFENWESEFLQMGMYVLLTVFLFQKGSSESKKPDTLTRVDIILRDPQSLKDAPWPVRRGGWILKVYEHSLSLSLFLLFILSLVLHARGGAEEYYQSELQPHGLPPISLIKYMATSRFWFESFQNWQSEFFSMGVIVVLSIFLREKGSPQSKPVDSPISETESG
jgi:uncharacterized protein DUF6766